MTKCLFSVLLILCTTFAAHAQGLFYAKVFGKTDGVLLVFLHGRAGI